MKPETVTLDTGIAEIETAASLQCVCQTLTTEPARSHS